MPSEWLPLLAGIKTTRRTLSAGERLFTAGDPADNVFHIERGRLVMARRTVGGEEVILHVAEKGSLFAEAALFSDIYHCDARAEKPTTVAAFPKRAVLLHLKVHPDLNLAFTAYLARQLQNARFRLEVMGRKTAKEKVLAVLAHAGGALVLDRPLAHWAAELGLTHEALYRTLRKLTDQGVVQRTGKRGFSLAGVP